MDNPNPIYYRDLITPDDSIKTLIAQLDDLIGKYETAKSKIQGAAAETAKSMGALSGATEEQRQKISQLTTESDKLAEAYKKSNDAESETYRRRQQVIQAVKEQQRIDKLVVELTNSKAGSYNKLSAQYRLNKIRLNEMSAEERKGTEAGRQLEAETAAIYEEMKRLQEATGKHQLNVGNYADAAKGLRMELTSLIQQMALMKTNGEENSEEYQKMAQRAGALKDAMADAQAEVKNMSSDTKELDTAMGAASAASGGMSAVTGTMALMGSTSDTVSDAQKKLGATIGIVSGLTAVQNALQKESNLMTGIRTIQTRAATRAELLDAAAKKKNTAATAGATIAQKVFNLVASANPYVLLAIALITVVGALVAFSIGANKAAKEQDKLNKAMAAELDYMETLAKTASDSSNQRVQTLQNELEVAKARNASLEETRKIEDDIYSERVKAHDKQMQIYAEQISSLEANRVKLTQLQKTLYELQKAQAAGKNRLRVDVDLDGNLERVKIEKAIELVQGQIDNYGRSVQIAVDLQTEGAEMAKERAVQLEQRRKEAQQIAKTETDTIRSSQDARLALIRDAYKRETATAKATAQRQIEDIKTRLKTETDLTVKARKALNAQIVAIQSKLSLDLEDLRNKYYAIDLAARRETEDAQIALMADGAEKQREELRVSYQRQVEDLQNTLATERDLTDAQVEEITKRLALLGDQYAKDLAELNQSITIDQLEAESARIQLRLDAAREGTQEYIDLTVESLQKQREIELAENARLTEDVRQQESDINAKWDAVILEQTTKLAKDRALVLLDAQQELAASEFALLDSNERQKTQFQLMQERQRLQKILELDKAAAVKMSDVQRKAIENSIKAIDKEAKSLPYNNIYELLGLGVNSDQQSALNTAIGSVKDSISSLVASWNEAAEAAVNAANAQVDAAQRALDAEIEARNAGYANEVTTAQKELELAKRNQEEAVKQQQKAQKAQLAIDSITQASSLITASANIWSSLSGIPVVGPGLAAAALVTMWASFAAAKIKAVQVSRQTEQYGEGTVELLQGGSHASGHDIDLGTKPDGTRRRAEGGEFFAVINKRNSRKYRGIIPDVINSLNDGTFAERYQRANAAMSGYAVQLVGGSRTDVSGLERDVAAIRQQGDTTRYTDGQGNTIIRYRNLTRKINHD